MMPTFKTPIKEKDLISVRIYGASNARVEQINGEDFFLTLLDGPYSGECFIRTAAELGVA
jgi:hypothetical protein